MDDPSELRFDGCVATNIEQAYRHLEQVYEHLISPLGLSVWEWYALRALYVEDGLSASTLAALVCRHPSSMTALLDRMESKNLLRRQVDRDDRRSVRVFLTEPGRALEPRVRSIADRLDRLVSASITRDEMDTFLHVLGVLQNLDLTAPGP